MRKRIRQTGIVALLGMLLLSSNFSMIKTQANDGTYSKDAQEETKVSIKNESLLPYITGFSFVDGDGKAFNQDYKIPVDKNTKVKITYDFNFPDTLTIAKNQKYQLQLPEYFLLGEDGIPETSLHSNQNIQAVWSVSQKGMITITFLEDVGKSAISGGLVIDSFVDKDKIDSETIDFGLGPISGTISVYPTAYVPKGEIEKTVHKDAFDKKTKEITWNLRVTPKENTKNLKGFTITDTFAIQGEQSFVDGSLYDETTKTILTPDVLDATSFSYTFPADTVDKEHVLRYRTKVTDAFYLSNLDKLDNTATLSKDGKNVSSSSASIQNIKQPVLEKTAGNYDPLTKKIAYTMIINKDEREIEDVYVQDIHPLQTRIDDITIFALDDLGNYTQELQPVQIEHNTQATNIETNITLGKIDKQIKITYTMEIMDLDRFLVDTNDYNKGYALTNVAKLFSDQTVLKTVSNTKSIAIGQGDGRASFTKRGNVIYGNPQINQFGSTIKWTVTINQNKANITKAGVFKDVLPLNLSYVEGSFKVNGEEKNNAYDEDSRTLTYTINPIGNSVYNIEFQTRINGWSYDKAENAHIATPNTASFTVDNEVQKASHDPQLKLGTMLAKSGSFDYTTQEFTWNIQVNQNQVATKDVLVIDNLPMGHELVHDTIVYSGNETENWNMMQQGQELVFSYNNGAMLCQDTTITFKTKYTINEGVLPDTYTAQNHVKLTSAHTSGVNASAKVEVSYLPSLTKTTTYKSGTTIPWTVGINHNGAYLVKEEAVLIDFLQPGLALDVDSVTLFQYKTGNKGEKVRIDVPSDYIHYSEQTREFRFTMPKGIDLHKAYDLAFTTNITILSLDEVTNTITFDGSRQDTISNAGRIPLMISGSSGFVKGENVTVSLVKQTEDKEPLQGAVFKLASIANASDYIEDEQTSDANGSLTFQADLKYEHDYIITELQAPKGYRLMDPLVLHIGKKVSENGKVFADVTFNNTTKRVYTDAYGFLDISEIITNELIVIGVQKVDDTPVAKPVVGAELGIYQLDGTIAKDIQGNDCTWISDGMIQEWKGIFAGDYVLKEKSAPAGHFQAADMYFTIDSKGNISVINQQQNHGNLLTMVDTTTNVSIQKQTKGEPLTGASLQILDEELNVVDAWISSEEAHIVRGLLKADTTYILHEVAPPLGYASATDITFTTCKDATLQEIIMEDAPLQIQITKLTEDTKKPLLGAKLALYDEDNNEVEAWITSAQPYQIKEKLQVHASYTLREVAAPAGYHKAEEQVFIVKDTDEVQSITMKDMPTRIHIEKIDAETQEPLQGAKLAIYDKDNTLLETWTSEQKAHEIIGKLVVGETYTLREEAAPAGYHKAEEQSFIVSETKDIQIITMQDMPTKIHIEKIDAKTQEPLQGAKLAIYDKDNTLLETWTSEQKAHEIIGKLVVGETYTLHEEAAPAGYHKANDISFIVDETVSEQVIVMEDENITSSENSIVSTGDSTHLYGLLCLCIASLLLLMKLKRSSICRS